MALQTAVGPATCALSALGEDAFIQTLPTDEEADVLERTIVLLGHVNGMLAQCRRQVILEEAGDKELMRLSEEDIPE